jgi:hypothetical protein
MGIKITDLYVNTVARGLLQPGEQLVARTSGQHQPWWSLQIPFLKHSYLLLVTSHRLIVVDHRKGLMHDRMDKVDSIPWSSIETAKLSGIGFTKKLVVKSPQVGKPIKMKIAGGFLSPKGNVDGAKAVVSTWQQSRQLGAAPQYGQLPAMQAAY